MAITPDAVVEVHAGSDISLSSADVAKVLNTSQTRKVIGIHMGLVRDEILEKAKGGKYRLRDAGRYDAPLCTLDTRRKILETDKVTIAAGERRKAAAKLASSRKDKPARGEKAGESLPPPQPAIKTAQKPSHEDSAVPNGTIPVDKPCKPVDKSVNKPVMSKSVIKRLAVQKPITTLEEIEAKVDEEKARDQRIRDAIEGLKRRAKKSDMEIAPVNELILKVNVLTELCEIEDGLSEILSSIASDLRRLDALAEHDK